MEKQKEAVDIEMFSNQRLPSVCKQKSGEPYYGAAHQDEIEMQPTILKQ